MTAAIASKLLELEARAGASDRDRDLWLAERRNGPTATEVRDLYLGKITVRELVDRKLGRTPEIGDLSHIPVIGWGKEREPIIAAEVERRYLIAPESRVFKAADNARKLASPDGVGIDFDGELVVSEIKTAGKDIAPGTEAFRAKGYLAQMIWVMRVIGARRCLYAWEERLTLPALQGFAPGALHFEWIEWDQELADRLEKIADDFIAALDAAAAEDAVIEVGDIFEDRERRQVRVGIDYRRNDSYEVMNLTDGLLVGEPFVLTGDQLRAHYRRVPAGPVIDEELDTLAVNYLRGLSEEKDGADLKKRSWDAILERVDAGEPVVQESALARVSFTPAIVEEKPVFELDQVRARAAAPAGLYERLEQAEDDLRQAQEAVDREQAAVTAHEAEFVVQARVERVVLKRAALRVTAAKETKGKAA